MLQIHEFFQNKMNFANELGKFALQRYRVYIYMHTHTDICAEANVRRARI